MSRHLVHQQLISLAGTKYETNGSTDLQENRSVVIFFSRLRGQLVTLTLQTVKYNIHVSPLEQCTCKSMITVFF